jgi:hypothetical protein
MFMIQIQFTGTQAHTAATPDGSERCERPSGMALRRSMVTFQFQAVCNRKSTMNMLNVHKVMTCLISSDQS